MTKPQGPKIARLMPLLVLGMTCITLGIVFTGLGNARFALMAVGLAMKLVFVIKVLGHHRRTKRSDSTRRAWALANARLPGP